MTRPKYMRKTKRVLVINKIGNEGCQEERQKI